MRPCVRSLLGVVLIPWLAGAAAAAPPSRFVYAGEPRELEVLRDRLAVLYEADFSELRQLAIAAEAGLPAREVIPAGLSRWHDLHLVSPLATLEDVDAAADALSRISGVAFVSPMFRDVGGYERVMMRDVLLEIDPGYRGDHGELLAAEAPEFVIVERRIGAMPDAYRLRGPYRNGFRVLEVANRLSEKAEIDWAEPDMIVGGVEDLIPNDPLFISLWGLRNTGGAFGGTRDMDMAADIAWEITTGTVAPGAVMIMDNGVQQDHPDLHQLPGQDFTGDGGDGGPVLAGDNHGTPVAGCVSAIIDNAIGVVGVSPDVPAVSARVCGSLCSPSGVAEALEWALDQGYRVTNWSFSVGETNVVRNAYRATNRGGVVHFSSAGNDGNPTIGFPQNLIWVHGVAALNDDGQLAGFSNYGPGLGYSAPGVSITTTDRTGAEGSSADDYTTTGGTSFAAPYAAGVAALALSVDPDRGIEEIENLLNRTAMDLGDPGWDEMFGWGFVNANGAVRFPTRRISHKTNGVEANGWSGQPTISETGRSLAFASEATNLVGGDDNGVRDVMAHNRETGRTRRLSVSTEGAQADGVSEHPSISATGRYVAFETEATTLVPLDTNGLRDIVLRDRDVSGDGTYDETGDVSTDRVSVATGGAEAIGGASWGASISAEGDRIAFTSEATNLVTADGNAVSDVFVREIGAGTTIRASVTHLDGEATGPSRNAALSGDGLHVAFESDAMDLVIGDTNGATDVFVRDLTAHATVRVSVASGGGQAAGASTAPAISATGRFVAFASDASDLVADGNGVSDVFVHDRDPDENGIYDEGNGTTARVSVKTDGTELSAASGSPTISGDGTEVAFETLSFAPAGSGTAVYVHSRTQLVTFLVSKSSLDDPGTGHSPRMSADGRMIAYDSDASNLVPFDSNGAQDVFLFQDNPCEPPEISLEPIAATVSPGDPFTLKTNATGSAPHYQWIKDGAEISGELGRWYAVGAAEVTDSGTYWVVVSNHCGSDASTQVLVLVTATGVEVVPTAPSTIALDPPAPSPFVERAAIRFGLPERSRVRLTIHDVAGRVVARLADGPREAGWHEIPWSGRDEAGVAAASGVYFVRLESAAGARTAKLVKLR